jgi:hypothetical protein
LRTGQPASSAASRSNAVIAQVLDDLPDQHGPTLLAIS